MARPSEQPERQMVRRALVPGAIAAAAAFGVGYAFGGGGVAVSAGLGIVIAVANFTAGALALGWAAGVSLAAVQAVALGGFFARLGIIGGMMAALHLISWFSPLAFGLAVAPGFLVLLVYESVFVMKGTGQTLVVPADARPVRGPARSDALPLEDRP